MESLSLVKPPQSMRLKAGRVTLMPGEEVGEHVTEGKEELIVVLKGEASLFLEGKAVKLRAGETRFIPVNTRHNVKNLSSGKLEYVYAVALA
jgi:putative monooxygenase